MNAASRREGGRLLEDLRYFNTFPIRHIIETNRITFKTVDPHMRLISIFYKGI